MGRWCPMRLQNFSRNISELERSLAVWPKFLAVVVALLLASCSEAAPSLTVRLVTGLVPGPEFRIVQTTILDAPAEAMNAHVLDGSEAVARFGVDYARGHDVAAFAMPRGSYRVRVRLLRPNGAFLVERIVSLSLEGNTVLPVHITRDCVGVTCPSPGASAELSTCLEGRCVDPRCTPTAPEFCPDITFCLNASECGPTATCATQSCSEGLCTPVTDNDLCRSTEWCNPDVGAGCVPLMPIEESTAIVCGTICTVPDAPCRFGYWKCNGDSDPVCEDLTNRPTGFVCALDRVCDVVGDCVASSTSGAGFIVTPASGLTTTERGSMTTFTMALATQPAADVTVAIATSDYTEGGVAPVLARFTPLDWNAPHTVTVTGINDGDRDGTVAYTIITAPAMSDDPNYNGLDPADVSVINIDDDTPGVTLSRTSELATTETGGSDSFTIVLNALPQAPVSIALSSGTPSEASVLPASVTFTTLNWAAPQVVTVRGVDDFVRDGDAAFLVVTDATSSSDVDYDSIDVPDVTGVNVDNETAGTVVVPTSTLAVNEAGASAVFGVALRSQPAADVTISIASTDTSEGTIGVASLLFTPSNWNVQQVYSVTGVNDAIADGTQPFAIRIGPSTSADPNYDALAPYDLPVLNYDDETAGFQLSPSGALATSETATTATFSVVLRSEPTADVTFSLTSTDTSEGTVSLSSLTFTSANWNTPQSVIVTGADDAIADGQQTYEIVVHVQSTTDTTYAALGDQRFYLVNNDDESAGITVTPTSGLVTTEAGGTASFTVVLTAQPTDDVVISLASSDPTEGAVAPAELTFTGSNWMMAQTVVVTGVDDAFPDSNINYTIVTSPAVSASDAYNGMLVADVSVQNTNDDPWPYTQEAYAKPSNTGANDTFGYAIAISSDGNTMAVGAPNEDSSATGVNGNQNDETATTSGAVYVFTRTGSTWTQQAYVKASNTEMNDRFGFSVALSSDGNTLAVGAYSEASGATGINGNQADNTFFIGGAGAVYVLSRTGVTWSQEAYVKASNTGNADWFGYAIALSADGNTMAVGASNEWSNGQGVGANQLDNSAGAAGAVYVFTRVASTWSQQIYIKASNAESGDKFGWSLSLSSDGNTLAVGAPDERSNATGIGGNQGNNGALSAGAVYVFTRAASVWTQQAYIKASNTQAGDKFGTSVSLSGDGDRLAVGAPQEDSASVGIGGDQASNASMGSGAVYLFLRTASVWAQSHYIKASNTGVNDYFGTSVALSSDGLLLAVGATGERSSATGVGGDESDDSLGNIGAAYSFIRTGAVWTQQAYLKASHIDGATGKSFGASLALSSDGDTMVVSGPGECSSATGIGGSEAGSGATNSGAVYVFIGT